jgi:CO/xanthine dehydrogenase FAD-binding subunit
MTHVAHLAIRNRGTIGGSITHADPAAELPMMMCLLDAQISLATPEGPRVIDACDFFLGPLTSAVEENEIVTEIYLPALPEGTGWAFDEFARRAGDFALAAVGVLISVAQGRVTAMRIGVMGVGDTPLRMTQAESLLTGQVVTEAAVASVVSAIREAVEPPSDLHAPGEYRRHLVGVLAQRVIEQAWQRATGAHHD